MSEEYDPAFECYKTWFRGDESDSGGAADDDGGDYAEEEEARINKALEAWNNRNTNKEGGSTDNPTVATRKMKAPEDDAPVGAPSIPKKEVVYKATDILTNNATVSQNELLITKAGASTKQSLNKEDKLSITTQITEPLSLSSAKLPIHNIDSILTKLPTEDLALAILDKIDNLKPFIDAHTNIKTVIENNNPIEATIILLSYKRGICYLNLIHNLYPNKCYQHIKNKLVWLVNHGIIEIKDKNNGFQEQASLYENSILHKCKNSRALMQSIVYYGLTQKAILIIPKFITELEGVIPKDVLKEVKQRYMTELLTHTKHQHKFKDEQSTKITNIKINELINNPTLKLKFGKDVASELTKRFINEHGSEASKNMTLLQYQQERLLILEAMYKEANKRR